MLAAISEGGNYAGKDAICLGGLKMKYHDSSMNTVRSGREKTYSDSTNKYKTCTESYKG